jgi:type III pantothenate kinase
VWLLDLGNTRLKLASSVGGSLGPVTALAHGEPGFEARLHDGLAGARPGTPALLASVAGPEVTQRVTALLAARGLRIESVRTQARWAGVQVAYADPSRLGVDRFLALLAAHARGGDRLIVSFGSALTLDLLAADGRHLGGLIGMAPGHQIAALGERFPALARGVGDPTVAWASDTPDAVAAGARRQAVGLVMAAWADAIDTLGHAPRLLLCGGAAADFVAPLAHGLGVAPECAEGLVLEGLLAYAAAA